MKLRILYFTLFVFFLRSVSFSCQCPVTTLSLAECNKYEIIFKGRIDSVKNCNQNFGEAFFTVDELYKGNIPKQFKVLFECGIECAQQFNAGEEWIIYTSFKQISNGKIDWCSRSRKYFKIAKQDFYAVNYGNSYEDEVEFLQKNLGLHRMVSETKNATENRNARPSTTQMIIILLCSLAGVILFYWLFNKFFKF
jgi:hypothetical protein